MKICKNCGQQTSDDKIRCPKCGYLFEEDMDSVLRQMKDNLNSYKQEIATGSAAPQSSASVPAQAQAGEAPSEDKAMKEKFELLSEVAQLKGELRALSSEVDRMQAQRNLQLQMQQDGGHPAAQVSQQGQPTTVIYAQPYASPQPGYIPANSYAQQVAAAAKGAKKARSGNRIFISIVCILALAASIGMFFLAWIKDGFKGFDSITYILGRGSEPFEAFLENVIRGHLFAGNDFIANLSEQFCYYVTRYGIVVYAVLLVLGFPLLFSMFGRVKMCGWHRFFAWISFIAAALLFGVFCWVSGFSTITVWFLVGAGANFVRCIFLAFYKKTDKLKGGLQG